MYPAHPQPSLLSLPPELRLRIYEYIFPRKPHLTPHLKQPQDLALAASLFRTCKKFHTEASPLLYSKNTFLISNPELCQKWLSRIGPRNTTLLRSLRIWIDPVSDTDYTPFTSAKNQHSWYELLARLRRDATGLQDVDIFWDAKPSWQKFGARRDLEFLRELGRVRGVSNTCLVVLVEGYISSSSRMEWIYPTPLANIPTVMFGNF
ncbi:hypothetical protein BDR22DRAFT_964553 [Usnea florida]